MSNPLSERLRAHARESLELAEAIEALYESREKYKHEAVRMASIVDRQGCTYAERQIADALEGLEVG